MKEGKQCVFFFFQAEDGIRDLIVTGVQTCALPIFRLSAERDVETLLRLILSRAREITHSDAGSIYLVEEPEGGPRRLRFEISQNDSASVPLGEPGPARPAAAHVPISDESIAGHVALTGE